MKKIAAILLAMACATPLFAQADDPGPPDREEADPPAHEKPMEHRFWDRLRLTDDQRAKLHQIRVADEEGIRSAWAQVAISREVLKAALLANPENTADIQAKATNLANALSATAIRIATHRAKINQVLTPVQRVALNEAQEHWMHQRRGRRGSGPEERGGWRGRGEEQWHGKREERGEEPRYERRHEREQDQSSEQTPATPQESQPLATPEASQTPGTPNG